jgi:hypothetical protein
MGNAPSSVDLPSSPEPPPSSRDPRAGSDATPSRPSSSRRAADAILYRFAFDAYEICAGSVQPTLVDDGAREDAPRWMLEVRDDAERTRWSRATRAVDGFVARSRIESSIRAFFLSTRSGAHILDASPFVRSRRRALSLPAPAQAGDDVRVHVSDHLRLVSNARERRVDFLAPREEIVYALRRVLLLPHWSPYDRVRAARAVP